MMGLILLGGCQQSDNNAALLDAAQKGDLAKVERLLKRGADINAVDDEERTPLILAAFEGHIQVVKALVLAGAKLDVREKKYGNTALMLASIRGDTEVAKLLLARGPM